MMALARMSHMEPHVATGAAIGVPIVMPFDLMRAVNVESTCRLPVFGSGVCISFARLLGG